MDTNSILFQGCSPIPMAHYLKALGILKIISEQVDQKVNGKWTGDYFELKTSLTRESLVDFLINKYEPTPMIAPWNRGSGFYYQEEKLKERDPVSGKKIKTGKRTQSTEATMAVDSILTSKTKRLENYRSVLQSTKNFLTSINGLEAPDKEMKQSFIQNIRNNIPDSVLPWIDTTVVLTADKPSYPPLLGTGGNDGNLDYSSNFMQRIISLMDLESGDPSPDSKDYIESSLFIKPVNNLIQKAAIGQFLPGSVGGPNSTIGFDSDSLTNPWDYILMMEGTPLFAASSSKRTGNLGIGALRYPFSVRTVSAGYGSSANTDEGDTSRGEIWLPLWNRPISLLELKVLLSEGRAMVGRKYAVNGLDFARSTAMLGVDRGINSFQRYGFQMRNGRSYFATPLGRFHVKRKPEVDLLMEVDSWMDNFRRNAQKDHTPTSIPRALRNLEESMMNLCQDSGSRRIQDVLINLGQCERAMVNSSKWTKENFLYPVPILSPNWLISSDDGSPEFRIASAIASVYGKYKDRQGSQRTVLIRENLETGIAGKKDGTSYSFFKEENEKEMVWVDGNLITSLIRVIDRRIMNASRGGSTSYPDRGLGLASLSDIATFIDGALDDKRIEELLYGLILVDWYSAWEHKDKLRHGDDDIFPGAGYSIPKLCFAGGKISDEDIPMVPDIIRKLSSGDMPGAMKRAELRLRGSGIITTTNGALVSPETSRRIGASILIPISQKQVGLLMGHVTKINYGKEAEK